MKISLLTIIILLILKNGFSLTIDDAVKSTIENNKKVQIALEKLNESKEILENALGKKLPTVTATLSGTYSNNDTKTSIRMIQSIALVSVVVIVHSCGFARALYLFTFPNHNFLHIHVLIIYHFYIIMDSYSTYVLYYK